jgi:hypothetical protein
MKAQGLKCSIGIAAAIMGVCSVFSVNGLLSGSHYSALAAEPASTTKQIPELDLKRLRKDFVEAYDSEFEILKTVAQRRSNYHGGQNFWLAYVKPRRTGVYTIKYRYNYNDALYSYVEREFYLRVGEKGSSRGVENHQTGGFTRVCLGDTVIVPILLAEYKRPFSEHQFSLKRSVESPDSPLQVASKGPLANQAPKESRLAEVPYFKFIDQSAYKSLFRNGGYRLQESAQLQAQKAGRFNLQLSKNYSEPEAKSEPKNANSVALKNPNYLGIPILIVERDAPISIPLCHQEVIGYNEQGKPASVGGDNFITTLQILQVGETISVPFASSHVTAKQEWVENSKKSGKDSDKDDLTSMLSGTASKLSINMAPNIEYLPFALNQEHSYNEWIEPTLLK